MESGLDASRNSGASSELRAAAYDENNRLTTSESRSQMDNFTTIYSDNGHASKMGHRLKTDDSTTMMIGFEGNIADSKSSFRGSNFRPTKRDGDEYEIPMTTKTNCEPSNQYKRMSSIHTDAAGIEDDLRS